jgi:shikimate kinase
MVCLALADAILEVLGGDTMAQLRQPFARLRLAPRARLGHVFLLGPMGVGKSAAGLILSRRMELPFVDLDARIEARAGTTIREIFRTLGEAGFRALEEEVLAEVCTQRPAVVALGGGAVVAESAWRNMRRAGVTVRLHAPPEELMRRLRTRPEGIESRPLLAGEDPAEKLASLVAERERWYARADLHLETTSLSAEEVAGAVIGLLRSVEGPMGPLAGGAGRGKGGAS